MMKLFVCFQNFSAASGLKANVNKRSVYFGGRDTATTQNILNMLHNTRGMLAF